MLTAALGNEEVVSDLELDNGLTERSKEVYSASRDDKPSRFSHADSRLLSSNIFSLSEMFSTDGRQSLAANAEEVNDGKLTFLSQLVSRLEHGREILQCK